MNEDRINKLIKLEYLDKQEMKIEEQRKNLRIRMKKIKKAKKEIHKLLNN